MTRSSLIIYFCRLEEQLATSVSILNPGPPYISMLILDIEINPKFRPLTLHKRQIMDSYEQK